MAAPGTVLIAASTRRLIGTRFELEDLGPQSIKGFAEVVRAWRVLGEGSGQQPVRGAHDQPHPLVGREQEVALLLDRWQQARDGDGQVVLLSGEPGIGKSRIARALCERLDGVPQSPLGTSARPIMPTRRSTR